LMLIAFIGNGEEAILSRVKRNAARVSKVLI